MRIIDNWQYRYIEKCLYNYNDIEKSELETERKMKIAIDNTLEFFKDNPHEIMMIKFYFKADKYRKEMSGKQHYKWICNNILFTRESNGFVIRREIIYRVAMNCYALGLFKMEV